MAGDVLDRFSLATREWFRSNFAAPTPAQAGAWDAISSGRHTLVVAPTGSARRSPPSCGRSTGWPPSPRAEASARCRVLYVSPLKALAVDVERNLRSPAGRHRARRRPARAARARHHGRRPLRRHPGRGAARRSPATRPTSSSPRRSRCSCCSPPRRARRCAASRR